MWNCEIPLTALSTGYHASIKAEFRTFYPRMSEITTREIALRMEDSTIVFCGLNSVLQIRIIYRENCLIISGKTPPTDNRIVYVSTFPHCRRLSRERGQLPQHNRHPQQNLQRGSHPLLRCSQSRYGGQADVYCIFTSGWQCLTSMYIAFTILEKILW